MRFFIKNYGCQMNSYDSRRMADILISAGHAHACSLLQANLIILNTCSIREKVDGKIFSDIGRLKLLKEKASGNFFIVVVGCMAQSRFSDIVRRTPYVDIILGPQNIHLIAEIVDDIIKNKVLDATISTSEDAESKFRQLPNKFSDRGVSEFLTIQEGCNNFCSYCVVPFTRGREFSRGVLDIVQEVKNLISLGVKEITLLGQNVNSYNGEGRGRRNYSFPDLLFELAHMDGLKRLRYTTSNPRDVDENLARAHKEIEILMPSLHLPVQSGADAILKKMNRKYTRNEYVRCVEMLREYRPDLAFSSDFIVGFPGETDADFQQTLELAESIGYAQAYSFKYSPRSGTPAAQMPNPVPEDIKSERLQILQNLLDDQQLKFNQNFIGQYLNVLFVKEGRHEKQLVGRSEYSQSVSSTAAAASVGDIVNVRITEVASHSLIGVIDQ
ncbi:MAG: tRNA (N6-isopentenyl adenosine(37)-C2)-methylthiotransferase MiaB [Holosporaceae bacterium]|jgi:tRNA-2-methylthio-N6-dimethylallyladenosine synthase|nr:tRNA (N6-isopentenyl adenosine(37)-C2)-methylthiotransferase MiaB [Holosporaceae bacterium]